MRRALLLVLLAFGPLLSAETAGNGMGPSYTAASLVNAASNLPGPLAPNTIASLYGTNLAYVTRAVTVEDVRPGVLPALLPGAGVSVLLGPFRCRLYFASPGQINILIPSILTPGEYELHVVLDGRAGPAVKVNLQSAAPALFMDQNGSAIATRPDGSVVTTELPAHSGDVVVLYATGLGQTVPRLGDGEIATAAAGIEGRSRFRILLNDEPIDDARIFYVGVTPGFAGLYQINVVLPEVLGDDPEIRISLGDEMSAPGPRLLLRPR